MKISFETDKALFPTDISIPPGLKTKPGMDFRDHI